MLGPGGRTRGAGASLRLIWTLSNVPILWIWTRTRMRGRLLTFKYAILQTDINVDEDEEEREAPGVGRPELITD